MAVAPADAAPREQPSPSPGPRRSCGWSLPASPPQSSPSGHGSRQGALQGSTAAEPWGSAAVAGQGGAEGTPEGRQKGRRPRRPGVQREAEGAHSEGRELGRRQSPELTWCTSRPRGLLDAPSGCSSTSLSAHPPDPLGAAHRPVGACLLERSEPQKDSWSGAGEDHTESCSLTSHTPNRTLSGEPT